MDNLKNTDKNGEYLEVIYSEERKPKNDYPKLLAKYLKELHLNGSGSMLDVGCGRGDLMHEFYGLGYKIRGLDISLSSKEFCSPHLVDTINFENEKFPFKDGSFSFLYSKSVIEHLNNPLHTMKESYRVLERGGKAVFLTPSWNHTCSTSFYIDHTHVTPFTLPSLRDALLMSGFKDVKVVYFTQLPFVWGRPKLDYMVRLLAKIPFPYAPVQDVRLPQSINKFVRFSKETMLLATCSK
jgi:SAM-dependent methyltransferase